MTGEKLRKYSKAFYVKVGDREVIGWERQMVNKNSQELLY